MDGAGRVDRFDEPAHTWFLWKFVFVYTYPNTVKQMSTSKLYNEMCILQLLIKKWRAGKFQILYNVTIVTYEFDWVKSGM
jgi:hypothetical protein